MLFTIKSSLDSFLNEFDEIKNSEFIGMTDEDLFSLMYSDEFNNSAYLLQLDESFDDFSFFAFTADDEAGAPGKNIEIGY